MTLAEKTIQYNTATKRAIVQSFRSVFQDHPDQLLAKTRVTIEYPQDQASYPALIVRFFERDIKNFGVGHREEFQISAPTTGLLPSIDDIPASDLYPASVSTGTQIKRFKHYIFTGDVEFAIYALRIADRDLIADAVVQILAMGDLQNYTNHFYERIYAPDITTHPEAKWSWINFNTDHLQGMGETQTPTPWESKNEFLYQKGYRIAVNGEFYSLDPPNKTFGIVEHVHQYPYLRDVEPIPTGTADPAPWSSD